MVITKTIKEYVERTIGDKINKKVDEIRRIDEKKLHKIQPQVDKINEDARLKICKLLEKEGLNPHEYGYGETNYYPHSPILRSQCYYSPKNRFDIINSILLKIELDEIPRKEVKNFVDNYEIDFSKDSF